MQISDVLRSLSNIQRVHSDIGVYLHKRSSLPGYEIDELVELVIRYDEGTNTVIFEEES